MACDTNITLGQAQADYVTRFMTSEVRSERDCLASIADSLEKIAEDKTVNK